MKGDVVGDPRPIGMRDRCDDQYHSVFRFSNIPFSFPLVLCAFSLCLNNHSQLPTIVLFLGWWRDWLFRRRHVVEDGADHLVARLLGLDVFRRNWKRRIGKRLVEKALSGNQELSVDGVPRARSGGNEHISVETADGVRLLGGNVRLSLIERKERNHQCLQIRHEFCFRLIHLLLTPGAVTHNAETLLNR